MGRGAVGDKKCTRVEQVQEGGRRGPILTVRAEAAVTRLAVLSMIGQDLREIRSNIILLVLPRQEGNPLALAQFIGFFRDYEVAVGPVQGGNVP